MTNVFSVLLGLYKSFLSQLKTSAQVKNCSACSVGKNVKRDKVFWLSREPTAPISRLPGLYV